MRTTSGVFRDKLVRALQAEGLETSVWQSFILPAMTVFQKQNGYGHGCPWACPHAASVDYSAERFPAALKHCFSHTGMTTPLRAPNGPDFARLVARAFQKVLTNVDQLERID